MTGEDWPSFSRRNIRNELDSDRGLHWDHESKRMSAWEAISFIRLLGRLAALELALSDDGYEREVQPEHMQKAADRLNNALVRVIKRREAEAQERAESEGEGGA